MAINPSNSKKESKTSVDEKPIKKLTQQQLRFCELYLQGIPAGRAYMQAGYNAKYANYARQYAAVLLTNHSVRAYIDAERKKIKKTFELNRGMLIENLMNIAMGKITEEQPIARLVGGGIQEIEIVKKKTNPKDRVKATEILLRLITEDDDDSLPATTESTDSKILTALRTRKVSGDEPEAQEEQNDADE